MEEQKKKTKMLIRPLGCIVIMSVFLVLFRYNQKQQEKYGKAYETYKEVSQDMHATAGLIDSENATLSYSIPHGYVYDEQNSKDNSKIYIAGDYSRVICVSFGETDKKYTKPDIDALVSGNLDSGYTESSESYSSYDFHVYRYSENSGDNNAVKPVSVSTYLCVQDRYIICVDDILYSEENDMQDVSRLLNSLFFYETSQN